MLTFEDMKGLIHVLTSVESDCIDLRKRKAVRSRNRSGSAIAFRSPSR
jgi:hypothetical protein